MRRVVVLLVLAACGRENFDNTASDAPITIDADTADHDGDDVPNASDRCPAQFDPMQLDGDSDGVGDACDPRPTTPGDRLASLGLFSQDFGPWVPDTIANWSLAGGRLTTTQAPNATNARLTLTIPGTEPTLTILFTVEDYGTIDADRLNLRINSSSSGNWSCHLGVVGGGAFDEVSLNREGTALQFASTVPVVPGSPTRYDMQVIGTGGGCNLAGIVAGAASVNASSASLTLTIEAVQARISLSHALVYVVD